jgi:hypothetical protein
MKQKNSPLGWRKHDTFSDHCWCKPKRDTQQPNLLIHNDGVGVDAPRKPRADTHPSQPKE